MRLSSRLQQPRKNKSLETRSFIEEPKKDPLIFYSYILFIVGIVLLIIVSAIEPEIMGIEDMKNIDGEFRIRGNVRDYIKSEGFRFALRLLNTPKNSSYLQGIS